MEVEVSSHLIPILLLTRLEFQFSWLGSSRSQSLFVVLMLKD